MKKDIELLEGDIIIMDDIYSPKTLNKTKFVWDAKNKKCVELEEYLKRIEPIKRRKKLEKLKNNLNEQGI